MRGAEFAELEAFCAVAGEGSFVGAARLLGVTPSAISQSVRSLEERLGQTLLTRTTRSVRLTEAGNLLLQQVRPAMEGIRNAVHSIRDDRPPGLPPLRLSVSSIPASLVLAPVMADFSRLHPDISVEITVDDNMLDIISGKFDAGIRHGWRISQDVEVVQVSRTAKMIVAAARSYLEKHGSPLTPYDLHAHNCVRLRMADGAFFKWKFMKDGHEFEVGVSGNLIVNSAELLLRAAIDGVGLVNVSEEYFDAYAQGREVEILLRGWETLPSAYYLYYPRGCLSRSLSLFIEFIRSRGSGNMTEI